MPKSARSPPKPRAKPKPSPKKKPLSSAFIDDEAEDSDDGVLVDRLTTPPAPSQYSKAKQEELDTELEEEDYDEEFINDGDPYEDGNVDDAGESEPGSPLPAPYKARGRAAHTPASSPRTPSPSKPAKAKDVSDIIDIDTSDEDLEAMAVDDSVFRKPAGLKKSALPPPLTTRIAASKRSVASSQDNVGADASKSKKARVESSFPGESPIPFPPGLPDDMTAAMAIWVSKFMEERAKHAKTSSSSSQVPLSPRIDFDQIELEKGIQASLESIPNTDLSDASGPDLSSLPVTRKSKNKAKGKARELSPDWDPPYAGEILAKSTTAVKPDLSTGTAIVKGESSGGGSDASALTKRKPERSSAKGSSFDVAKAAKGSLIGDVSTYMDKKPVPSASSSGGNVAGKPPLTMAQFLREKRGEPEPEGGDEPEKEPSPPVVSTDNPPVFLEDLETYKAYYDASVKCGVFDIDLQDEALREFYVGLPPLPPFRRIVPAYDRNRIAGDDTIDYSTGGRVQFSSWFKQLPRMLASNSMGAMLFTESEPNIINLSRVSPLRLSSQVSAGSSTTRQLHVDGRIAICVSAVCVTESYIVVPRKIGARSDRRRKTLSGVFHDQDWERFEAVVNLAFGETIMYGQMVDKSIAFQTMISPENKSSSIADAPVDRFNRSVPSSMFSTRSPGKHAAPSAASTPRVKTLLAYDDPVPVYDARKIAIDYQADLDRLSKVLPPFTGEIPSGSFAVVGYSCSTYAGTINSNTQKVPYVGLNILWVIVCGIPAH